MGRTGAAWRQLPLQMPKEVACFYANLLSTSPYVIAMVIAYTYYIFYCGAVRLFAAAIIYANIYCKNIVYIIANPMCRRGGV